MLNVTFAHIASVFVYARDLFGIFAVRTAGKRAKDCTAAAIFHPLHSEAYYEGMSTSLCGGGFPVYHVGMALYITFALDDMLGKAGAAAIFHSFALRSAQRRNHFISCIKWK